MCFTHLRTVSADDATTFGRVSSILLLSPIFNLLLTSVGEWGPGLLDALREVEDPRKPKGVRHPLPAVLALPACAMLSGARSLYAIAQWGREHPQFAQSLGVQP